MPKKTTITYSQLRVGIVLSIGLLIFAVTVLYVTRQGGLPLFSSQYTLYSYVGDVNGLKPGAPVHLSGVEIGAVDRVEFAEAGAPGPVRVTVRLRQSAQGRITDRSLLSVGSLGVLGEKMVDISPGEAGGVPIPDGGLVDGEAGDPIKGIITDASSTMKDVRDVVADVKAGRGSLGRILKGDEFHQRLVSFVDRAQELMGQLDSQSGTLGKLINDPEMYQNVNALAGDLREVAAKLRSGEGGLGRLINDEKTADALANTLQKMESLTQRLDEGEGSVGALIREREFYDKLNSLTGNIDAVAARLERGDGTAGQLLHDRALYDNLNTTASELQALIADIREDPRKYLRIKVSLF